jgi:L,D-peptidoglycan transpeptidase YkuD (ErfK/YbiS/YcfS/YnhG family)
MSFNISINQAPVGARVVFQGKSYAALAGKAGLWGVKREGDGRSPRGIYQVEFGFYRADRINKPKTQLPMLALSPYLGWCDDPNHRDYNTLVDLPFKASHEKLFREDHLYDLGLVLSHNRAPSIKGYGSAIFIHCREPKTKHTQGCIALNLSDLLEIVHGLSTGDIVRFGV